MNTYDTAKQILTELPRVVLRPQPATDWTGEYPLPSAVADYFKHLGPVDLSIESYGNPYSLPSLAGLWAHQIGYRTHGITGERLEDWLDDWLVVGDQGADPFIFSRATGRIFHAYHGEGIWKPDEIFENLPEMVTSFAIIGEIVERAGTDLTDDDSLIRPRYLEEALARMRAFTGATRAVEIAASLGWSEH